LIQFSGRPNLSIPKGETVLSDTAGSLKDDQTGHFDHWPSAEKIVNSHLSFTEG